MLVPGAAGALSEEPPEDDGSGPATAPADQTVPVPSTQWAGWGADGHCDWITPAMLDEFGATGEPQPAGMMGCVIALSEPDHVQIGWSPFPYHAASTAHFIRPITIAGLQAREYAYLGQGENDCSLNVNARSVTYLHIAVWDPDDPTSGSSEPRCEIGRRIAEASVREYVPLVGGTPYDGPQQPDLSAFYAANGTDSSDETLACQIVRPAVAFGHLQEDGESRSQELGSTCTHTRSDIATGEALLAVDMPGGLDGLEPTGSDPVDRQLASLPARLEDGGWTCSLAVELDATTVLRFTYSYSEDFSLDDACGLAELIAGRALTNLLNLTT